MSPRLPSGGDEFTDTVQSPPAGIQMLSDDLLFDIFTLCYPVATPQSSQTPVTGYEVCQRWRDIILSSGQFWSHISLSQSRPNLDRIEAWVDRSANCLLRITLLECVFQEKSIPIMRRLMRILIPHSQRWGSVYIRDVPEKITRILLDRMRGEKFPRLHTIRAPNNFILKLSKVGIPCDPRNVEAQVSNASYAIPPFKIWLNLTVLRISDNSHYPNLLETAWVNLVLSVLEGAPQLRGFALEFPLAFSSELFARVSHISPNLKPLFRHAALELLEFPNHNVVDQVLMSVELPRLRLLPYRYSLPSWVLPVIHPNKAWPDLENVILDGGRILGYDYVWESAAIEADLAFVSRLPLKELRLRGYTFSEVYDVVQIAQLFPRLNVLEFHECDGLSPEDAKELVEAKNWDLRRLRVSGSSCTAPPSPQHSSWFEEHLQEFRWAISYPYNHRKVERRLLPHWDVLTEENWLFP